MVRRSSTVRFSRTSICRKGRLPQLAEHQRDAFERILILLAGYGGALLADEAGLGKSYIAAAVAADRRRDGFEVDVIVPATLVSQWRQTLGDFGVRAAV